MSVDVLSAVRARLTAREVPFEEIEHGEVRTAEEAAAARGLPLEQGAKSLVFKIDDRFVSVVYMWCAV